MTWQRGNLLNEGTCLINTVYVSRNRNIIYGVYIEVKYTLSIKARLQPKEMLKRIYHNV